MHPLNHSLFVKFIVYFNRNQDYFECHEVLEQYWKSIPNYDKTHPLTAYILIATGMYHWRRGNTSGALRTFKTALNRMENISDQLVAFTDGIDFDRLQLNVRQSIQKIKTGSPFTPFPIIVTSSILSNIVEKIEPSMNLLPMGSQYVIHKHMLRDRTNILAERKEKKKGRPF